MGTATELTIEHYQRPEVREIITRSAMSRDGALSDFRLDMTNFDERVVVPDPHVELAKKVV